MKIKIISSRGKSWGSYIDHGMTIVEIEKLFPLTEIGNFNDGFKLRNLLEKLGHEVDLEIQDAYEDNMKTT